MCINFWLSQKKYKISKNISKPPLIHKITIPKSKNNKSFISNKKDNFLSDTFIQQVLLSLQKKRMAKLTKKNLKIIKISKQKEIDSKKLENIQKEININKKNNSEININFKKIIQKYNTKKIKNTNNKKSLKDNFEINDNKNTYEKEKNSSSEKEYFYDSNNKNSNNLHLTQINVYLNQTVMNSDKKNCSTKSNSNNSLIKIKSENLSEDFNTKKFNNEIIDENKSVKNTYEKTNKYEQKIDQNNEILKINQNKKSYEDKKTINFNQENNDFYNKKLEIKKFKNYEQINYKDIIAGFKKLSYSNVLENRDQSYELKIARKLKNTLEEFGIDAQIKDITRGPVITCYEIQLAKGVRVSKLLNLQDNIALVLATSSIRIITPIQGKSVVGIEIPNLKRDLVTLGDLLISKEFKNQNYKLPLILGKGGSGKIILSDLTNLPHLLIAGATGMGKSVFLNALISGLIYSKTPSQVRFLMIDPKRVELKIYDEIAYLLSPVITEPKKALSALKWVISEMERRYMLLENYSCRNISSYHEKISLLQEKNYVTDQMLEYIVVVIDEFADLILVCGKELEEQIARLAAMSRAVGIHLVVATQRPSVDVITGLIKANFPARVAFQVSSKTESRIILDTNGADKLLGKGDLLFTAPAISNLERIQGAFLTENEVHELNSYIRNLSPPTYIKELENINSTENKELYGSEEVDSLYHEAIETILLERRASASYLQRKMKIGYNRAARLIELMEKEGIVSHANGSKPREILIQSYTKK